MSGYVAPASKVFTVAHIPSSEAAEGEGAVPQTRCGLQMDPLECWLPVPLLPGDGVCARCTDPESGTGEQGMLL